MGILVQPNKITFPKDSKRPNLGASLVACLVDDDDDDEWCSGGAKWRMQCGLTLCTSFTDREAERVERWWWRNENGPKFPLN